MKWLFCEGKPKIVIFEVRRVIFETLELALKTEGRLSVVLGVSSEVVPPGFIRLSPPPMGTGPHTATLYGRGPPKEHPHSYLAPAPLWTPRKECS